jgi:hypothetical protein
MNGAWTKAHFWQQYDQIKLSERQKKVVNRLLDAGPEGFEGPTAAGQRHFANWTSYSKWVYSRGRGKGER